MTQSNRGTWSNWFEFAFSCIGSMVGLGNVWRFPYICFKNGGGAFLIPYLIFMFTIAMPTMFLEFAIAQYSSLGPAKVWLCCPLFKGIGYGMILVGWIISSYYSVVITWTLFYFGNSFFSPLPWSSCNNTWNTDSCYIRTFSGNIVQNMTGNITYHRRSIKSDNDEYVYQTSSEEFWEHRVLGLTSSINELGSLRWELVLCAFGTWAVVSLALIKGIKTSGKFMLFASTLPYLFLAILLIRGILLPGAVDGIKYFFIPRWKDLLKFSVWSDAAVQVFYSSSLGIGELITLASHNHFKNNCHRDALLLPFVDVFTSLFAGCVIFSTLGYTASVSNTNIESVVKQGPGIAFMVYPDALSTLPLPQIWSALFFFLLFMIGVNSQIVVIQVISGGIFDTFPRLATAKKTLITTVLCIAGFLINFIYLTQGGMYVLQLIDWYIASIPRMFLINIEILAIVYMYGAARLSSDISVMIGHKPPKIWKYIWVFITAPLITFIWIFMVVEHEEVKYGTTAYPSWSIGIGWSLSILPIVIILLGMIHTTYNRTGNLLQRLRKSIKPDSKWKSSAENEYEFDPAVIRMLNGDNSRT